MSKSNLDRLDFEPMHPLDGISKKDNLELIQAKKLFTEMTEAAEKYMTLSNLCEEALVQRIRASVSYIWFECFIKGAQKWLSMRKSKYDRRKKYEEQVAYNALVDILKEELDVKKLHIVDIIEYGPGGYGYCLKFIADSDYVFLLSVPVIKAMNLSNYKEFDCGKLRFGYMTEKSVHTYIQSSYYLRDFKEAMQHIHTDEQYKKHYVYTPDTDTKE